MRDHCCQEMRTRLQVTTMLAPHLVSDRPVVYDAVFDEYRLASPSGIPDAAPLQTCPWCTTRLPASKRDRWFGELDRLGLRPDDPGLPDRYATDAWWNGNDHPEPRPTTGPRAPQWSSTDELRS